MLIGLTNIGDVNRRSAIQNQVAFTVSAWVNAVPYPPKLQRELALWLMVWDDKNWPEREWFIESAEPRLEYIVTRVMKQARVSGVPIPRRPKTWQSKPWTDMFLEPMILLGKVDRDGVAMVLNTSALYVFSDSDLEILVAHELGHCFDIQTHRRGSNSFTRSALFLASEPFADEFAVRLYGRERIKQFNAIIGK